MIRCRILYDGSTAGRMHAPRADAAAHFFDVHECWLPTPLPVDTATALEIALQRAFKLPADSTVFAIRRHDEPFGPPLPLVLAPSLFALGLDDMLVLDAIVRPNVAMPQARARLSEPPGRRVVCVETLTRGCAQDRANEAAELVRALSTCGVARLRYDPSLRAAMCEAAQAARALFGSDRTAARARAACALTRLEDGEATSRRVAGYARDRTREWLQVRRELPPRRDGGAACVPRATPAPIQRLFALSELRARELLVAIAAALGLPAAALTSDVLDPPPLGARAPAQGGCSPPAPPRSIEGAPSAVEAGQQGGGLGGLAPTVRAGASVLRCYRYQQARCAEGQPRERPAALQGAHADLGLLTLSPLSDVPAFESWDPDALAWARCEADAQSAPEQCDALCFAGETLALLTGGRIPAVIHRVTMAPAARERFSMPFFARARPDAMLRPPPMRPQQRCNMDSGHAADGSGGSCCGRGTAARLSDGDCCAACGGLSCRRFMVEHLFARRPWRPTPPSGGCVSDY